ncbi:hypothetical protein GCM10020256_22150 [Streptomyces thermocoprophilus]
MPQFGRLSPPRGAGHKRAPPTYTWNQSFRPKEGCIGSAPGEADTSAGTVVRDDVLKAHRRTEEVECEGDPSFHRPSRPPRPPEAPERSGPQSALVLACGDA